MEIFLLKKLVSSFTQTCLFCEVPIPINSDVGLTKQNDLYR